MYNSMAQVILSRKDAVIDNLTKKIREIEHIPQDIKKCRQAIQQLQKHYDQLSCQQSQITMNHQISRQAIELQHILIDLIATRQKSHQNFTLITENIVSSNQVKNQIMELQQQSSEKAKQTQVSLFNIAKLRHSKEEKQKQLQIQRNDKAQLMQQCDKLCQKLQFTIKQAQQLQKSKQNKQNTIKLRSTRLQQLEKHHQQILRQQKLQKQELERCREDRNKLKQAIFVKKSAEGIKEQIADSKNTIGQLADKALQLSVQLKETRQKHTNIEDKIMIEKTLNLKLKNNKNRYLKENNRISQEIDSLKKKIERIQVRNGELMDSLGEVFECNNRLQYVLGRYVIQS